MGAVRDKFRELLALASEEQKVVSIYRSDADSDKMDVGFVEEITSDEVALLALTPRGEADGRLFLKLDHIAAVEYDDPYTRKIQLLYTYRGSVFHEPSKTEEGLRTADDHLFHALENSAVVTIEDQGGSEFTGFVKDIGLEYVIMELLNPYGHPDGKVILQRERIDRIQMGRREQQMRGFLFKHDHGLRRLLDN